MALSIYSILQTSFMKNTHDYRIELARALMSQGNGPEFSKKLEAKIKRLRIKVSQGAGVFVNHQHFN